MADVTTQKKGRMRVPRKHVETVDGEVIRLGSFVDNSRRKAAKLSVEPRADPVLGPHRFAGLGDQGHDVEWPTFLSDALPRRTSARSHRRCGTRVKW